MPKSTSSVQAPEVSTAKSPAISTTPESSLHAAVKALETNAVALSVEVKKQRERVNNLTATNQKQDEVRAGVEAETIPFAKGSVDLAALSAEADLLVFTIEKRAPELRNAYVNLRSNALDLKVAVLGHIDRAQAWQVAARQKEISAMMATWGSSEGDTSTPVSLRTLLANCPVLQKLEGHRTNLGALRPGAGVSRILEVCKTAVEDLAGLEALPEQEPLWGGYANNSHSVIRAWYGKERRHEIVAEFDSRGEAEAYFSTLRGRTGFLGLRDILMFDESNPCAVYSYVAGDAIEPDRLDISACFERDHSGRCEIFFGEVERWLAPAAA